MSHTDVIEKNRIEKLWFSFKNWFICFFPHELTCMGSYHLLLKFPPIKHTIFFTKRQCVTSSEIWVTGQTKHRGLGGGPVCFFERDAIFLECSKANFDEFWKIFDIKFWCHTLTHGTVLRRLPLGQGRSEDQPHGLDRKLKVYTGQFRNSLDKWKFLYT